MKLFKKKEKQKKIRDKKGCLKKLAIFGMFFLVFVIGLVNGINAVNKIHGETLNTVANYIKKINEPVVESEVIFNPTAEFSVFTNKAEEFEFYGYQNLDDVLELKSNSMTFTDAEIGSLISSKLKNESGLLYLGEFTISSQNTIRAVYVYDLGVVSSALEEAGDIVPDKMYITVNYEYTVTKNQYNESIIQFTVIDKQLNKLEMDLSNKILGYLDRVEEKENVKNPLDTYDEIVFDILNTIALKTTTNITLNTGVITYSK